MSEPADIPRLLREVRRRTGLTQEKLAAKLGVAFPTLNRWENARAKPSPLALKQIDALLQELGAQGEDFLLHEPSPLPPVSEPWPAEDVSREKDGEHQ